ncbi:MAG: methyl-accepting chemotaxis protein [Proteobacteria bacterium]|nr:methyl-accepting chemotaxis protein [Pseudomonadota bacterium]
MRVEIGYKFIIGFIIVIGAVVLAPHLTQLFNIPEGLKNIVSTLVAIVVGLSIGSVFSKNFSRNFQSISIVAEEVSKGNLKEREILTSRPLFEDEMVDLETSLQNMMANLRNLVLHTKESSMHVSNSAQGLSATAEEMNASNQEISSTIEQIANGAELQTDMVGRTSKFIKDMAFSIGEIAEVSKEAAEKGVQTAYAAGNGSMQAAEVTKKLKGVFAKIEDSSEVVFQFGNKTQEISKIVDVITRIAQQTNLLALNATIEAARAGEYGRGFAVVAEEVKKLAESSTASAEQITELIKEIEEESAKAVNSLRESTGLITEGREGLEVTGQILEEIVARAEESKERSSRISKLTVGQLEGSEEMVKAVEEIAKVAEDNAASTQQASAATQEQMASMEEMSSAAQELSELAEETLRIVDRFEV